MSIPSVSVNRHDRYTPEIRDRIAEALRAPLSATAYHVLTPAAARGNWPSHLNDGSVERGAPTCQVCPMLRSIEDSRMRQGLQEEFARIEQAMDEELPGLGRGAAFFVMPAAGLVAADLRAAAAARRGTSRDAPLCPRAINRASRHRKSTAPPQGRGPPKFPQLPADRQLRLLGNWRGTRSRCPRPAVAQHGRRVFRRSAVRRQPRQSEPCHAEPVSVLDVQTGRVPVDAEGFPKHVIIRRERES